MTQSNRWFWLTISIISMALLYLLAPILLPFVSGALLAYLCDPLVDRFRKFKISRTLSVVVVFFVAFLVILPIFIFLVPLLESQIKLLVAKMPDYIDWIMVNLEPTLKDTFGISIPALEIEQLKATFGEQFSNAGGFFKGLVRTISHSGMVVAGWAANLFLIPVITFYLLRDWDNLVAYIHDLLPRSVEVTVSRLAKESDEVLGAFLRGQMLVMLALGTIYAIGLKLVGLEFSLLIGMLAGILSFIPYMGLIVGIIVAGGAIMLQTHDPSNLLWVAAVFVVAQVIEGTILTPLLVGDRIGLHPVAVIFSVLAGGQLFGFFGILLALPVFAVIAVIMRHFHKSYKDSHLYDDFDPGEQEKIAEHSQSSMSSTQDAPPEQLTLNIKLRDGYIFDSYYVAVDSKNAEVVSVLKALFATAEVQQNIVWGESLSGKTHLLQACCAKATEANQTVSYIPLKVFKTYGTAVLQGLSQSNLLVIDDIDEVLGDKAWEVALFNLINIARENGQSLLFSSVQNPRKLEGILPDLASRLIWGGSYQLQALSDDEKPKALQARAEQRGFELSDRVIEYVYRRYPRDIESLMEILNKLDEESFRQKALITVPFAKQILEDS